MPPPRGGGGGLALNCRYVVYGPTLRLHTFPEAGEGECAGGKRLRCTAPQGESPSGVRIYFLTAYRSAINSLCPESPERVFSRH